MKTIKFTKVERQELEVLQDELDKFRDIQSLGLCFWSIDEFLNALLSIDISFQLWLQLRKKIESENETFNLKFNVSEAVIILKCCHWKRDARTDYQKLVAEKFKNSIDQQLKSLIPTEQ